MRPCGAVDGGARGSAGTPARTAEGSLAAAAAEKVESSSDLLTEARVGEGRALAYQSDLGSASICPFAYLQALCHQETHLG